jgi:acyl-CoA reductase-like NAD-dependent aldehyde dehydrogenase
VYGTEAKVQLATHQDIDQAIDAAVKAQPAMAALGSYERKTILLQVPFLRPAS